MKFLKLFFLIVIINLSCPTSKIKKGDSIVSTSGSDTTSVFISDTDAITTNTVKNVQNENLNPTTVSKHELVRFANSLIGIPYKYASTDPSQGFDCSGFITYVFNHFDLKVPRSSVDFTNIGQEINLMDAKEGDLILFTGTNDSIRIVGHMGIVTENSDTLRFIHSTSGRANGVTISNLEDYYKKRFVKVIRIFFE